MRNFIAARPKLHLALCLLIPPFVILYATQLIWTQNLLTALGWVFTHPAAAWGFWLLFSLLSLTLYGFFRRLALACLPGTVTVLLLALISWYKFRINGAPLQLSDFSMAGGMGEIVGYVTSLLTPTIPTLLAILLSAATLFLLAKWEPAKIPVVPGFVLGSLCMVLLISASGYGVIQTAAVNLDAGIQDQEERCGKVGVCLSLYVALAHRIADRCENFGDDSREMAERFQEDREGTFTADLSSPDIIFVTSEAFFDVTRLPNLTFSTDPLPNYHALAENCTDGECVTDTFGGGTGLVEMSMFLGFPTSFLREGDALDSLPLTVYDKMPSTVRLLKASGYSTLAMHSFTSTLYHRDVNYPHIGFDDVLFMDDFLTPIEKKGPYPSDECFAREIIARYEKRDPTKPCFIYGMSMENHQAYSAEKFPEPSGISVASDRLNADDIAILDSLLVGLHDADASLGELVRYFSQVDRPVCLVFVGDHLPSVKTADGGSLYAALDYFPEETAQCSPEQLREKLSTNYLIWTNYEKKPQSDRWESSNFLGMHTLQRAGIEYNAYFRWLERDIASHLLMALNEKIFVQPDGTPVFEKAGSIQTAMTRYLAVTRSMVYPSQAQTSSE